jgi:hypothetical protein
MSKTPRTDAQYAELSALLDDGEISYDDALISMRDKSIELERENAELMEVLERRHAEQSYPMPDYVRDALKAKGGAL